MPTAAQVSARAERLRSQFEADRLAAELGCEVITHPRFAGLFDARDSAPGLWLLSGAADEIRAEWRAAWLQVWLTSYLGTLRAARRQPLTAREREVAVLVAQGLTDQQAAARLSVSLRTVHAHLRNIYAKTRTGSRVRLVNWLAETNNFDDPAQQQPGDGQDP